MNFTKKKEIEKSLPPTEPNPAHSYPSLAPTSPSLLGRGPSSRGWPAQRSGPASSLCLNDRWAPPLLSLASGTRTSSPTSGLWLTPNLSAPSSPRDRATNTDRATRTQTGQTRRTSRIHPIPLPALTTRRGRILPPSRARQSTAAIVGMRPSLRPGPYSSLSLSL